MANTLMFEVGIKSAQEQLDKIKQEFTKANKDLSNLLNIKVSIDGVDAVVKALSQIGDTSALRSLRNEIAALNREFSILSKGAGGSGDIAGRGLAADIERTSQSIDRYTSKIKQLTEERTRLVGGTRNSSYQNYTDEILRYEQSLEGAKKKLAELNEQKNKPIASEPLKKSTQDAQAFETALGRIETAISGLKSGMSVNLTGDFAKWAQDVQSVTASVRELVEQLQKITTADGLKTVATSAQAAGDRLTYLKEELDSVQKKLATAEERTNKYYDAQFAAREQISKGIVGLKDDTYFTEYEIGRKKVQSITEEARVLINTLSQLKDVTSRTAFKDTIFETHAKFLTSNKDAIKPIINDIKSYLDVLKSSPVKDDDIKARIQAAKELLDVYKSIDRAQTGFSNAVSKGHLITGDQLSGLKRERDEIQKEIQQLQLKGTTQGGILDPQQFTALQEAITKIIAEINRLKEAFSGIGEIKGMTQLTESMNALFHNVSTFKDIFSTLSAAVNLTPTSEYVKKLQQDFEAAQAKVQELTEKLTSLAAVQNQVAETAAKAGKSEQQIGDSQSALFNRYNKLLADIQNIKREIVEIQRGAGGGGPFGDKLGDYFSALNRIRNIVREITSSPSVADAITKGMSSEQLAKLNSALAALKTNFKEVIADAKDFNKATDKGSSQAEARIRKLGMAFNELKNYMKANGGSEEMKRLQTEIQGAIRKMRDLMNAGNFAGAINVYERLSGIIRQAATATKEFENSQNNLSSTVSKTNTNLMGQSQILSDLKTMAMQYLSVWGAQNFINNIIELGGQLEQQRLSIGAILQDTAQANHLFSQIKDLAIKSPFGVQQLDAMTKQLSAYGFQYSELYEWTKRLADISAATGTSVDRLALALGHVRSEGALSGYTLRQFSMGNIPLLQKLSENLGKTKQEIRKMTRNKEIGYEDVLNVLKQLTDEGGMFFEAQETMAQALNAKFKNLRDSFQIMYSEMAEGAPGDFLKGLATTLTDLSRQWQILMPMVGAAGAMWAMNKASAALVNVELAKMATLTNANTLASSKYSVAQLRQIANWEKMPHAMVRARLALQGFRTSLLSLGKMVFSWPTAIFAAIEALTYMWAKQSRESEKAKEMTEVLTNTALESQKNLSKQLSNIDPYEKGMSDSAMKTGIDSMTESIKNYGVNAQAVLEKVYGKDAEGRVMSLAEKYQYLRGELEKTAEVYRELQRTSDAFQFGVEYSDGGWFDDDVQTDLTNYANAVKEYEDAFTTMSANYSHAIQKALEVAKNASPAFKAVADRLSSDAERIKFLYEHQDYYGNEYNLFKSALHREDPNAGGGVLGYALGDNLRNAEREANKELEQFFTGVEEKLKKFGYNFTEGGKNLTEVQVGNLLRQSKEWLEKHPEWSNIYDTIWDKLNKRWGLPIVPEVTEIEEELPQWLLDFQKELDKTGIKLTATMSMEQIVDEMKKAYDKAQTTINKLGPIALQAKVNIQGLTDDDIEEYNNPLSFKYNPELYNTLKQLKGASDAKSQVDAAAKKRGLKLEGMKKDGSHKAEKQNQEAAKAVREQVRVIKEAADAFQYWREKVGDKGAWTHVQAEFGDVLKKIGITADNIEDVRGHLKKIPQMKEYKAISDDKVKTEIKKEIAKDNDQFIRKDFERDTEEFLSKTQIQIDNLTRAWDTFNSVREATGNIELAIQLSGADYENGENRNLADALKKQILQDFTAAGAVEIPFDVNLSDKEIEEIIKKAIPNESEERIKGIVEEYKKWRDLQRDVVKNDTSVFLKAWDDEYDRKQEFDKIVSQYEESKKSLDTLLRQWLSGAIDANGNRLGITQEQYNRAFGNLTIRTDWEKFKNENDFKWVFDNIGTTSLDTIQKMIKAMREYAKTTEMGEKETKAWHEAMDKLLDQESILNPLQSIADAAKSYSDAVAKRKNAEEALRISKMSRAERRRNGINENDVVPLQQAQDDYRQALSDEEKALLRVTKAINAFANKVSELGSALSSLGSSIGGEFGDIMNGVGGMLGDLGNGMNSATKLAEAMKTKGFSGTIGKVTATIGIINSIVDFNQKLDSILPSSESIYQKYADRQRKINELQEQIADYQVEALKRQIEETNWLYNEGLSELRNQGYVKKNLLKEYANSMLRPQEIYQEARSGISKWGPAIVGAIVGVVGAVLTLGIGSIGSAALGATIAGALGATATAAVGAALAAGAGAAIGTALRSAADQFFYGEGQTSARDNMRVQTQHKTFFRGEKTQNLEDWVRDNYGKELFDKDHYDLIDIELAKKILEDGPTLVGETRETLERLVEYAEQIREIEDGVKDYVSQMFSPLVENMTDALWDWLDTGKDILDSFEDYASDTFKNIAKDAVKSFLKINLIDKYQDKLNDIYTAYSLGVYSEQELGLAVASVAGEIKTSLESLSPALQVLGETLENAFETQGYDIVNGSKSSSSSASTTIKSVTEQTADLIASYLNAVRADVSVNRAMIAQYFPLYYSALTNGNRSLANIEGHTLAIMRSNDTIAMKITSLDDNINGLKNKAWKVPMA